MDSTESLESIIGNPIVIERKAWPEPACALCRDTGFMSVERDGIKGASRCTCKLKVMAAKRDVRLFGAEYQAGAQIEHLDGRARDAAEAFVAAFKESPGLLSLGNVGTGKTYAASATANELLKNQIRSLVFATVPFLLRDLRREELSGGTAAPLYRSTIDADLLVLDDLGSQKNSEFTEQLIYMIVSERGNKPLIVTGNTSLENLQISIGQRTLDRILGRCQKRLLIEGQSRRWERRTANGN
jgi:DNA replication protein DnaC